MQENETPNVQKEMGIFFPLKTNKKTPNNKKQLQPGVLDSLQCQ